MMCALSPASDPGAEAVPGGNVYPKYTTRNPIARRLVAGFLSALQELVRQSGAREIHEVGCGEGYLTTLLAKQGCRIRGSDLSPAAIAEARRRAAALGLDIPFAIADIYDLERGRDSAELVLCCEVLEHLPDPQRALERLHEITARHLIVSVPREPLWRLLNLARGRYWPALGNTPGHLQHWSRSAFLEFLKRRFEVIATRTPLPWTMALCRKR